MAKEPTKSNTDKPVKTKAASKVKFPTSPTSPFPDGYDLHGERAACAHLIAAENPDFKDPLWDRYMTLLDREEILMKQAQHRKQRSYAERIVPDNEALGISMIGGLVQEENDELSIHTKEAYRLFIGRSRDDSPTGYGISSAKKVGAILRSVWHLSSNDNPYADWMLIQFTNQIEEVRQSLEKATKVHQDDLDKLEKRGLTVHVMKSRAPMKVNLGFRSPYGYMVTEMLLDFDWYVRLVKTMVGRSRMSDEEGHADMNKFRTRIRSIFESALPFQKYLLRDELKTLSRSDFLSSADAQAQKRVKAIRGIFGDVPANIFTGELAPKHSRRKLFISEQEQALLNAVAADIGNESGTAGLENTKSGGAASADGTENLV